MTASVYRLKTPLIAVIKHGTSYRLSQLTGGSLFLPSDSKPDSDGMIEGTYEGNIVLVFARDLVGRPSLYLSKQPPATVLIRT